MNVMSFVSVSEIHYSCINAVNCTKKNMSENLLLELGYADANMYLCSEYLRPSKNRFLQYVMRNVAQSKISVLH